MNDALQQLLDRLTALLAEKPLIGAWYTTVVRFVFPPLAATNGSLSDISFMT